MNLTNAQPGVGYLVREVCSHDPELEQFLFSLGCYPDQPITLISRLRGGYVVSIKEGRYTIDRDLAQAILLQ